TLGHPGDLGAYSVNVSHVLAAGASAGFRMNDVHGGTLGLLVNNSSDLAYLGEASLPTNNAASVHEVVFNGSWSGGGHHPDLCGEFVGSTGHPDVESFRDSAARMYGGGGTAVNVTVIDPYRF